MPCVARRDGVVCERAKVLFIFGAQRSGKRAVTLVVGKRVTASRVSVEIKHRLIDSEILCRKTAKKLCQDIVYSIYASGNGAKKNISSEDISAFSADGEYINRTVKKIERVKRVGF